MTVCVSLCHHTASKQPPAAAAPRSRPLLLFCFRRHTMLQLEFPPGGAVPPGFGPGRWYDLDVAGALDDTFDLWGDSPFAVLRGTGAVREKFGAFFAPFLFAYDGSRAIELHNLEGLLAQFVFVSDGLSLSDEQPEFGHAALDPAFLYGVFERLLALGLDASAASDGSVRARLAKSCQDYASEFADDDRFRVKNVHIIPLERVYDGGGSPLLYNRPSATIWSQPRDGWQSST